ncbi:MAG TPA: type II secretion system minor pseudopilin GspK [Dissulfurispiraceae bacterium]
MSNAQRTKAYRNSEGMALVLVLLVVAILTAVVVEFSYGVYINTNALYNWQTSQKLSLSARSALKLASEVISENLDRYSYTHPDLLKDYNDKVFADSQGSVSVRVDDEGGRFNLNTLIFPNGTLNTDAYDSFSRLLKALKLDPVIADRVADWIDPDPEPRAGDSEVNAKNSPLDSVDELLLIKGIDRASYERLLPYVTIYGSGLININCAEVPVLMSLSDSIDNEMAQRIVSYRANNPFERADNILKVAGFETIGQSLMGRISVKSSVFRILATARSGDIRRTIESVLEMSYGSPFVRYWREL